MIFPRGGSYDIPRREGWVAGEVKGKGTEVKADYSDSDMLPMVFTVDDQLIYSNISDISHDMKTEKRGISKRITVDSLAINLQPQPHSTFGLIGVFFTALFTSENIAFF